MANPLMLSTWSFGLRGHAAAWPALAAGGAALDAVETASCTIDADPEIDSVGFGGYPDASGEMTLDGSIMLAPDRCGSVCVCARHLHPVSIARRVMERTEHVMLAGPGVDAFAKGEGFEETTLLADHMREKWEAWKKSPAPVSQKDDRMDAEGRARPVDRGGGALFDDEGEARWSSHDTIGTLALDAAGVLAGACSTSGTAYKIPGRVGDSPIIGHGLYVDPRHGAATASGWGELMMGSCTSFFIVGEMRRGATPSDALAAALARLRDDHELREHHQVGLLAMRPNGQWAAAALRSGFKASVTDGSGPRVAEPGFVLL